MRSTERPERRMLTSTSKPYQCFMCNPNPLTLQQDIELLKTFKKCAIFFDSYNTAIDVIEQLTELPAQTKFIVAVRTGVHDVRLHEIQAKLPTPSIELI